MVSRIVIFAFIFILVGSASLSCSEDIPECPGKMCVIAGSWQLVEVYVDGAKDNGNFSNYQLTLNMSDPSATTSDFIRIQPSGASDNGTWSIENNDQILRLIPDNNPLLTEEWIIKKFTPRQLILIITRDTGIKDGPGSIEFVLEQI